MKFAQRDQHEPSELMAAGVRDANVAGFAALRAVVESVDAEPDILLRLAKAAVFLAGAILLRLVAQGTEGCGHASFFVAFRKLS